ncbi:iron-sulfur cluster-binding domain-containing protein [Rheinheimera texasensis]|uniref:iron-sulfur cluster-binding domain-containing protein n=1 Tax=Rheinheimera texasensis TaxID=306205 RepID=UPI0032B16D33
MIVFIALTLMLILPLCRSLQATIEWLQHRQAQQQHRPALTLRVSRVRRQRRYLQLTLVATDGQALPPARAGQHIQLFGTDAAGQQISRAYSLAQDCLHSHFYRLVIKAETGGRLSSKLFDTVRAGDLLQASIPKGHFILKRSRKPLVLVAGGVGITPMLAMAYQALRQRRPVTLFYQARTAADLLFHRLFSRLPGLHYVPVLSQPTPDWLGGHGRINSVQLLALGGRQATYYCCANAAMTAQLSSDLAKAGVTLHYELFSAGATQQSCLLQYKDISADAAGFSSVLDALNSAGAAIPSDCRGGSCGLCKKRLIKGEIIQMLDPAAPLAAGEVLTCCIQAKTALVLAD